MSSYKALVFDLDGTLADTLGDLTVAMNKMLVAYGWPRRTRDELLTCINRGARYFVSHAMPETVSDNDRLVSQALECYDRKYAEALCVHTAPYAGVKDALAALKAAGYKLAVLSNKQDGRVHAIIEKLFPDTFDVICGLKAMPAKPDPMSAWAIAGQLGLKGEDCVLIGESDVDMETAKNAGMYPLAALWGYRDEATLRAAGAKDVVRTPDELVRTIASLKRGGLFSKLFGR